MGEGSVMVTFKIMPEGVETDIESLQEEIEEQIKPSKLKVIPIAFGLKSLLVVKVIPEKDGEMERVEKQIRSISGVKEVEVTNVARSW
jgi:elongation factor 1-beta